MYYWYLCNINMSSNNNMDYGLVDEDGVIDMV